MKQLEATIPRKLMMFRIRRFLAVKFGLQSFDSGSLAEFLFT